MYFSNLMTADNRHIPGDFPGGSKPPPYYVVVCAVLFVRRIQLKRRLLCNLKINKHKSNSLIPSQPKQGGSETKPLFVPTIMGVSISEERANTNQVESYSQLVIGFILFSVNESTL